MQKIIFKNISFREKLLFLVTFVVIFAVICYNFLIEPVINKITLADKEIFAKSLELQKINRLLLEKDEINKIYQKYSQGIATKGESDEEAVARFLSNVESMARGSSVLVNDVKPKPIKDMGHYKRFNFDLEIEGSIDNITKFIYELEKSPEAIRVERLQISVKTGKADVLSAEMSIAKLAMP